MVAEEKVCVIFTNRAIKLCKIVYDGAEGMGAYNNRNDMVAAYMCRFGIGQNAALVNTETRANMAGVVRDMCQYTTEVDVEIKYRYNEDGSIKSSYEVRTLVIHVTYKGIGQIKRSMDLMKNSVNLRI